MSNLSHCLKSHVAHSAHLFITLQMLRDVNHVVDSSIGITTGLVFCGLVGHARRHEYTSAAPT